MKSKSIPDMILYDLENMPQIKGDSSDIKYEINTDALCTNQDVGKVLNTFVDIKTKLNMNNLNVFRHLPVPDSFQSLP